MGSLDRHRLDRMDSMGSSLDRQHNRGVVPPPLPPRSRVPPVPPRSTSAQGMNSGEFSNLALFESHVYATHAQYMEHNGLSLYHSHENSVDSDPVIIPYKVINRTFTTLYGIMKGLLSVCEV